MVQSSAKNVPDYIASLPAERAAVVAELRRLIREHLPPGYEERMGFGMLCYEVPLSRYPDTYNGQPLCYIGLAAQKNGYSLYLTGPYLYGDEGARKFRAAWAKSGKKLDMGKSCVRFKRIEDLALDVVAENIASIPVDAYIHQYEAVRANTASGKRAVKAKAAPAGSKSSNKGIAPAKKSVKGAPRKKSPGPGSKASRAVSSAKAGRGRR